MTKELKIKDNRIKKLLSELELKLRDLFKDNLRKDSFIRLLCARPSEQEWEYACRVIMR